MNNIKNKLEKSVPKTMPPTHQGHIHTFKSMFRPILEYASSVWHGHRKEVGWVGQSPPRFWV